jgi:hypothetical protein
VIGNVHLETLRDQVETARAQLAGWEALLAYAEANEPKSHSFPNPLQAAVPPPWPVPSQGRQPYQQPIDGGQLPPKQEGAFNAFEADHKELARTPEQVREDEKWRQA